MNNRKVIQVFFSYAHDDRIYFEVFINAFEKNIKSLNKFELKIWDDRKLFTGSLWDNEIQKKLDESDLAILLVSDSFLASNYIRDKEVGELIKKYRILIIPVLLAPCFYLNWEELSAYQFFKPDGDRYGMPAQQNFSFADLVMFRGTDGQLIENVNIRRYIQDLILEIVKALSVSLKIKIEKQVLQTESETILAESKDDLEMETPKAEPNEDNRLRFMKLSQIVNTLSVQQSGFGYSDNRAQVFAELKIALNNNVEAAFDFLEKLLASDDPKLIQHSALLLVKMKKDPSIRSIREILKIIQTSSWLLFRRVGIKDITDSLINNRAKWGKDLHQEIVDVLKYISTYDDQNLVKTEANSSLVKLNTEDTLNYLVGYLSTTRSDDIVLQSLVSELVRANKPETKNAIASICQEATTDFAVLAHLAHWISANIRSFIAIEEELNTKIVNGMLKLYRSGNLNPQSMLAIITVLICLNPGKSFSVIKDTTAGNDLEKMKSLCLGITNPADELLSDFWQILFLEENSEYLDMVRNCVRRVLEEMKLLDYEERHIYDKIYKRIIK